MGSLFCRDTIEPRIIQQQACWMCVLFVICGLCLSFVLGDCVLVWLLELAVLLYLLSSPCASGRQQQARHTQLLPDSLF